jgi:septum formation protein
MNIVLASQSPRRKRLFEDAGLKFDIIVSYADEESVDKKGHAEHVKAIAKLKVDTVAEGMKNNSIVVGADTMVIFEGKRIGKPKSVEDAIKTLNMLSGKTHEVFTGVVMKNTKTGKEISDYSRTLVTFRKLNEKEITEWANTPDCLTGAGAYTDKIHYLFFEKIEGSHTNVMGLPMEKIIPMLRKMGVDV